MTDNINIKRKFKVNGKEYNSIEEMPDDIRDAVEKAMASGTDSGHQTGTAKRRTRIIFNGMEYDSMDAMPQEVRRLYENVLQASKSGNGSGIDIPETMRMPNDKISLGHDSMYKISQRTKFESSFSPRILIIFAGIIALLLLILYLRMRL